MKRVTLAVGLLLATGATASGDQLYWVVGNQTTERCDIVSSNPVIFGLPIYGPGGAHAYWFGDGPYKSKDEAKLARATIRACPLEPPEPDDK